MIILSTAYLAPVSYYRQLNNEETIIDLYDNYQKQSYRNRCRIATEAGIMDLTIPVEKVSAKTPAKDVRIARHDNWEHIHWTAITSAYSSSPFFEYYSDDFRPFYKRTTKYKYLADLNQALQDSVCRLLEITTHTKHTTEYILPGNNIYDLRQTIHPKKPSPHKEELLPYYQVFSHRNGFLPDLSIIDLLFNMGPEAVFLLQPNPAAL